MTDPDYGKLPTWTEKHRKKSYFWQIMVGIVVATIAFGYATILVR